MSTPTEESVTAALRQVVDPEIGMNIVDLGLVYGIDIAEGGLTVRMTMTSAACPMGDMIVDDVHVALAPLVGEAAKVDVQLVFDPPWTPARMSPHAREVFGWSGDDPA